MLAGNLRAPKFGIIVAAALMLVACESKEAAYDRGHADGYAVGYNTACEVRATMIAADWKIPAYSRGYSDGVTDGIIACNRERKRS